MMTLRQCFILGFIFNIEDETAILLDELYVDLIQMTKTMREFSHLGADLTNVILANPNFYQFDAQFNKKEEIYMFELKKHMDPNFFKISPRPLKVHTSTHISELPAKKLETMIYNIQFQNNNLIPNKKMKDNAKRVHEEEHKPIISGTKDNYFSLDNNNDPSEYGDDGGIDKLTVSNIYDNEKKLDFSPNSSDFRPFMTPFKYDFLSKGPENMYFQEQNRSDSKNFKDIYEKENPSIILQNDISLKDLKFSGLTTSMNSPRSIKNQQIDENKQLDQNGRVIKKRNYSENPHMKESIEMSNYYINSKKNSKENKANSFRFHEIN